LLPYVDDIPLLYIHIRRTYKATYKAHKGVHVRGVAAAHRDLIGCVCVCVGGGHTWIVPGRPWPSGRRMSLFSAHNCVGEGGQARCAYVFVFAFVCRWVCLREPHNTHTHTYTHIHTHTNTVDTIPPPKKKCKENLKSPDVCV
jgi:hypothetical protein